MRLDRTYRVALFGHRDFSGHRLLEERLTPLLGNLLKNKPYVEIYVGRNGEFDLFVATIVRRLQKMLGEDNNELICVLPYPEKNIEYYEEYYGSVIIPECLGKTHPKGAITKRNRWIVEQADLIICYVERDVGGAFAAMKYAEKLNKNIINLAQEQGTAIHGVD